MAIAPPPMSATPPPATPAPAPTSGAVAPNVTCEQCGCAGPLTTGADGQLMIAAAPMTDDLSGAPEGTAAEESIESPDQEAQEQAAGQGDAADATVANYAKSPAAKGMDKKRAAELLRGA